VFAQQKSVVVLQGETLIFETDGTFQRNQTLQVYKVSTSAALEGCSISDATLVGHLDPLSQPGGVSFLDVTDLITHGPNYFLSVHASDSTSNTSEFPSNCEQGARLIVYKGTFSCGDNNSPCSNAGPCVFDVKSSNFECWCPGGFIGSQCEQIDECFGVTACGNPIHQGVCVDGDCDFSCSCIGGYSSSDGSNKSCDIPPDNCDMQPCQNGGTCIEEFPGGTLEIECKCLPPFGFIACEDSLDPNNCSDLFCADKDNCDLNPCDNGATCITSLLNYTCSCLPGFTDDNCSTNIDDCFPSPCLNGGTCIDGIGDVTCNCPPPWSGKFCQVGDIDECSSRPCLNGGTCTDEVISFVCACPDGHTGSICETDVDECDSKPCLNGGLCDNHKNFFICHCPDGFTGVTCETDTSECISSPCSNGSTCLDLVNGYICLCAPNITGIRCETDIACIPSPCQNGGICQGQGNSFLCHCLTGFTGPLCQTNIDDCASNPCLNGGTCHDDTNEYTCACDPAFNGTHCEVIIGACSIYSPCKNDGTCLNIPTIIGNLSAVDFESPPDPGLDIHDTYACFCRSYFTGRVCETLLPMAFPPPPLLIPPPQTDGFNCSSTELCLNGGTCIAIATIEDAFCSCPFPFGGRRCEIDLDIVIAQFTSTLPSFLKVSGHLMHSTTNQIVISVNPLGPSGLIFLMAQNTEGHKDYIALYVVDAKPVFEFDLGTGIVSISSPQSIPYGVFTTIELRRDGKVGKLVIDGDVVATGMSPGTFEIIDVMDHFYLGGVPDPTAKTNPSIRALTSFDGCVQAVILDGNETDIMEQTVAGANVQQCPASPCFPNPCQNDGTCSRTGLLLSEFECSCADGYSGSICEIMSNPCTAQMPCMHGGECRLDNNATAGYRCICSVTHSGPQCEKATGNTTTGYEYAGDSYIVWNVNKYDIVDATAVSLQVYPKQNRSDGLLALFIRPSLDFFTIVVDDGFVTVIMDLGGGVTNVSTNARLPAEKFSIITVNRKGLNVELIVSGQGTLSTEVNGTFTELNVDKRFYLGGVPSYVLPTLPSALAKVQGFTGCIDEVTVNGQFLYSYDLLTSFNTKHCNVDLCDTSPCQNGGTCSATGNSMLCKCPHPFSGLWCEENVCQFANCSFGSTCMPLDGIAVCICPLGKVGKLCDEDAAFNVFLFRDNLTSFMAFPPLGEDVRGATTISVSIKPLENDGLIMYVARSVSPFFDFISIGLYDGYVEFRYNLGSDTVAIRSTERIELNRWHTIHAERTGRIGFLSVDGGMQVLGTSPGSSTLLDVVLEVYLGGHEDYSLVSDDAGLTSGFTGSITNAKINSRYLDFSSSSHGHGVSEDKDYPCNQIQCHNNGICTDVDNDGIFECQCSHGFEGDNCEIKINNNCTTGMNMCHKDSQCVFDFDQQTYDCFCPLTPYPRGGQFCEKINHLYVARFQGNGFASYLYPSQIFQTVIQFKLSSQFPNGLIFYVPPEPVDFIAIGIIDGQVELRYDLGSGPVSIRNSVNINITDHLEEWHYVLIRRENREASVVVDGVSVSGSSPGSAYKFNSPPGAQMYVGGIAVNSIGLSEYDDLLDGDFHMGLDGCIADLMVNDVTIDLEMHAIEGTNVGSCDDFFPG
jgi:hypothetical protein